MVVIGQRELPTGERVRPLSFASQYAEPVLGFVVNVSCPRCGNGGPHERIGVEPGGTHVVVACVDNLCALEWKVSGPEIER